MISTSHWMTIATTTILIINQAYGTFGDGNALSTPFTDGSGNSRLVGNGTANSTLFGDANALSRRFTDIAANSVLVDQENALSTMFTDGTTNWTLVGDGNAISTMFDNANDLSASLTNGTASSTLINDGNARSTQFGDGNLLSTPFTDGAANSTLVNDGNTRSTMFDNANALSTSLTNGTASSTLINDRNARSTQFGDGSLLSTPFTDGAANSTLVNDGNALSTLLTDGTANSTLVGDGNALSTLFTNVTANSTLFGDGNVSSTMSQVGSNNSTPFTDRNANSTLFDDGDFALLNLSQLSAPETTIHGPWLSYTVATLACLFLLVGLFGNGMTLAVTLKSETRFKPHNILIMSLAVTDTLSLVSNVFNIRAFGELSLIDMTALKATNTFTCKLFNATYRMSLLNSTLMIMLICIERFTVVWFPLKSRYFLTKRLTIVSVASCVMATLVVAVPSAMYTDVVDGTCYFTFDANGDGEQDTMQLLPLLLVMFVLTVIVPILTMLILTPLTIAKLYRQQAIRRGLTIQEPSTGPYRTSVLLTTVVVVYLLLVGIPHLVFTGMNLTGSNFTSSKEPRAVIIRLCFICLVQANYSTNFILYTMFNKEFRQNLLSMLGCFVCYCT